MKPLLVLGATGFTGRLVVQALEREGTPYIVAGRNAETLAALTETARHVVDARVFDARQAAHTHDLFEGVGAVINTVGPFARFGIDIVRAAIAADVHYVDTTGEQSFQKEVYLKCHKDAEKAGVTVMPGHAFEYAFSYCGMGILQKRCGPVFATNAYHRIRNFKPSRGTRRSFTAMAREDWFFCRARKLVAMPRSWSPTWVHLTGETHRVNCVPIPGGDIILLPGDYESLREVSCYLIAPRRQARRLAWLTKLQPRFKAVLGPDSVQRIGDLLSRRHKDPTVAERRKARWTVFVRGTSSTGSHLCKITGRDVYGTSADAVALAATRLAEGKGLAVGVRTTGTVFDAEEFLDALKRRGVRWELR